MTSIPTPLARSLCLAGALLLLLLPIVPGQAEPEGGIGGTGLGGEEGGIGGTGLGGDEDGIGGTGIYGTIAGFGSVWVNGLHIDYDEDVPVVVNGAPAQASDLALGQVVWIEATSRGDALRAERIRVVRALAGRVTAVDLARRTVEVSGQLVEAPEHAIVLGVRGALSGLEEGALVEVSGLRRSARRVVATRIDRADPSAPAVETGPGLRELLDASNDVRRVSVEGYLRPHAGERLRLGGLEVDVSALSARPAGLAQGRVWVSGRVTRDAGLRAERITPWSPERPPSARDVPVAPPPEPPEPEDLPTRDGANGSGDLVSPQAAPGATLLGAALPSVRPDALPSKPVLERPSLAERPLRPERPTLPDRPIRPERPERPSRPERVERPLRVERPAFDRLQR